MRVLDVDRVGFIGLGAMGAAIAGHLVRAGRTVIGWDRQPDAVREFSAAGGTPASGQSDVSMAELVISMVFDDAGTREIALGPGGLVESLAPGAIHVVAASISPVLSRELFEAHAARGQHYVAAPVFGRVEAAAAARLHVVCSGSRPGYERARPLLELVGVSRFVGPEPEQAMLVKSMGNSMIYTSIEMLREMFGFLRAGGIDEATAQQLLIDTLFDGQIFQQYAQRYLDDPDSLHMSAIARKDRHNCLSAADGLRAAVPLIRYLDDHDLP